MAIPSYKQVNIKSSAIETIHAQMSAQKYGHVPYIVDISHLGDQGIAIRNIEHVMDTLDVPTSPYPVYIVASMIEYNGPLEVFKTIKDCPGFFKQKVKPLNVKESTILQKINLKQKHLMQLRSEEYLPVLSEYASSHKTLNTLVREQEFLEKVKTKLQDQYVKKEQIR